MLQLPKPQDQVLLLQSEWLDVGTLQLQQQGAVCSPAFQLSGLKHSLKSKIQCNKAPAANTSTMFVELKSSTQLKAMLTRVLNAPARRLHTVHNILKHEVTSLGKGIKRSLSSFQASLWPYSRHWMGAGAGLSLPPKYCKMAICSLSLTSASFSLLMLWTQAVACTCNFVHIHTGELSRS